MDNKQIQLEFPAEEFEFLEKCCKKLGTTIQAFIVSTVLEKVDAWEDLWMLERWEIDGTRAEIENERNDPDRIVYVIEKGELKEVRYCDFIRKRNKGNC